MATLFKNARILTCDPADTEYAKADLLVEGSKIAAIGPDLAIAQPGPGDRVIDASGKLLMPGLVNGHFHSSGNFLKGLGFDGPLELYMLIEVPPLAETLPSRELNYARTMLGAVEMIKHGCTSVNDDCYFNPMPTPEAIEGIARAYLDAGFRATINLSQPIVPEYKKLPFLEKMLPASVLADMDKAAPPERAAEMLVLQKHLIDTWHGKGDGLLHAGMSISAPQRVPIPYFEALSDLSKAHDLCFNLHIYETKTQRVMGYENFGKSLIRYCYDLGLLDPRKMIIHSIWVDEADMEVMAATGVAVAHNPVCNLKIGSGIMPFRRLLEHGIPVGLGADEQGADDTCNMWGQAKTAGLMHRIGDPDFRRWPTSTELLTCLTRGGARGMWRQNQIGQLTPGYEADIIMIDLDTIAYTPLNDLRRQLVYCENGSSVAMTMIAGKVVAENGVVLTVDEKALRQEVHRLQAAFMASEYGAADKVKEELMPYYQDMYFRAAAMDVGMNRWAGPMTP